MGDKIDENYYHIAYFQELLLLCDRGGPSGPVLVGVCVDPGPV